LYICKFIIVVRFYCCLTSNPFSCRYASRIRGIKLLTLILSIKICSIIVGGCRCWGW